MSSVVEPRHAHTSTDRYVAAFEALKDRRPAGPRWLEATREAAIRRFAELGIPTTRDEEYRFTNVSPIAATAFERPADAARVETSAIVPYLFGADSATELVFVNGRVDQSLSLSGTGCSSAARWRSSTRRILPVALRGRSGRNSMNLGTL